MGKRKTKNRIVRTRTFEQKRTGKIMPKLSDMTEDLTVQLAEALSQLRVKDFPNVASYVKARHEIIKQFDATRKEMLDAVNKLNTTSNTRF